MKNLVYSVALALVVVLLAPNAHAVPAFGKSAGNVSCNACHATPTWQLNKTGLDFLKNGHREEPTKFDPEGISWDNYFSVVWKGRAYNDQARTARTQFEHHSFSLYTGGALAERWSYFTEMYFSENTGTTKKSTVDGYDGDAARKKLAEAFLQYNLPVTETSFVAFRAGEILPEIIHTFGAGARSIEDRAQILNAATNSNNPYKPFTRSQGVDAKLNWGMLEATLGVVNGAMANTNSIDSNNHKDLYAALQLELDHNGSAIGLFHYKGMYSLYSTQEDPTTSTTINNDFDKTLALARFVHDKFRVVGAYMMGNEEEDTNASKTKTKNKGYYALADYNFTKEFGLFARYDFLDPKKTTEFSEVKLITAGLNGLLYANKKSAARWNLELSKKETTKSSASANDTKTEKVLGQLTWSI